MKLTQSRWNAIFWFVWATLCTTVAYLMSGNPFLAAIVALYCLLKCGILQIKVDL
jgi:hypothetical protein